MKKPNWYFLGGSILMIALSFLFGPLAGGALRWVGSIILCVTLIDYFNSLAR